jgi:probable rRNA maturation factor
VPSPAELSLVLADDALVRRLNSTYRRKNVATNVLSFPALTAAERARAAAAGRPVRPAPLGDVVAAFETSRREAAALAKPLAHHLSHLIVHGTLHLLGYDHEAECQAQRMERLERRVLAALGIPDPYGGGRARAGRGKRVSNG